ncbi:glycosyltransferase [Entophlyctis helioformis]|nr:glycosyltransferase [Entophlyctis helioformis]
MALRRHLFVVVLIYRRSKIFPLWAIPLLMFSKRMHSIYTLRLFNDPVAMFFLFSSVLALTKKRWLRSSVLFSLALSVKMNVLLFAPGFAFVFFRNAGIFVSLGNALVVLAIQVVLAAPFLYTAPESYLTRAFDFGRQFDFKWTVNWRFVPEEIFSSPEFAMGLLALHVIFLVGFAATVWRRHIPRHYKPPMFTDCLTHASHSHDPDASDTLLILFSSNLIGIIFARSLHYQFYSWYFWTIPYLLWRTGLGFNAKIAIFIMIEYAWNVYPSTNTSSTTLLLAHLILLAAVAMGNPVHDKRKSLNGGESDVDSNASTDSDDDSKNKIKTE